MLPADRRAPISDAALAIGPEGATQSHSALVQGTLIHEEVHLWPRPARDRVMVALGAVTHPEGPR